MKDLLHFLRTLSTLCRNTLLAAMYAFLGEIQAAQITT